MTAPVVVTQAKGRTRLLTLQNTVIAGLIGNVLVNIVLQAFVVRGLIPPLTIIMVLTVGVAAVCVVRWRWAPLLAALWCVVAFIPGWKPYIFNLTHPADTGKFVATVFGLCLYFVAFVGGMAATITRDQLASVDRAPSWLRGFMIGLATFALGASLVSAIEPSSATAGVSSQELAQLPAVVAANARFQPAELHARAGETVALRLDNHDPEEHYFDIDELNVHVAMPSGTSALAVFRPTTPGTYTFYCQVPGHREAGMVGTLIVEP